MMCDVATPALCSERERCRFYSFLFSLFHSSGIAYKIQNYVFFGKMAEKCLVIAFFGLFFAIYWIKPPIFSIFGYFSRSRVVGPLATHAGSRRAQSSHWMDVRQAAERVHRSVNPAFSHNARRCPLFATHDDSLSNLFSPMPSAQAWRFCGRLYRQILAQT